MIATSNRSAVSATNLAPSAITRVSLGSSNAPLQMYGYLLDRGMLQHLLGHAAVAAADNQHAPGLAMGQNRHVRHHLVIDELVRFRGLHHAVEGQHAAEGLAFEQLQTLMPGLAVKQQLVDPDLDAKAVMEGFLRPLFHQSSPRRCSVTFTRLGPRHRRT
jgi:hypothetical protein